MEPNCAALPVIVTAALHPTDVFGPATSEISTWKRFGAHLRLEGSPDRCPSIYSELSPSAARRRVFLLTHLPRGRLSLLGCKAGADPASFPESFLLERRWCDYAQRVEVCFGTVGGLGVLVGNASAQFKTEAKPRS